MPNKFLLLISAIVFFNISYSCKLNEDDKKESNTLADTLPSNQIDTISLQLTDSITENPQKNSLTDSIIKLPDSALVEITNYNKAFKLDIRYATSNNFTKQVLYDCANCLLRKIVADSLAALQNELLELGYGILLFDCYRPLSVQQKMWEIVPNPIYVADPNKGSMHNRGNAVDLTLYHLSSGLPLEMGTEYDFFGREAHHAYKGFSEEILQNKTLLKTKMEKFGFQSITSEWWHYSFNRKVFHLSVQPIPCPQ